MAISNSMEAAVCVDCLVDALREHGNPKVSNSDKGSQFTSKIFIGLLRHKNIDTRIDGQPSMPPKPAGI